MQDTPPSDEYSVTYPIWALQSWLTEAQILETLPAFKNLQFEDLLQLQNEFFFEQNLSVPAVKRIMENIKVVKKQIEYMDILANLVQNCNVNEADDVIQMLTKLHKNVLPSQFTPMVGLLSCKFVELLGLIYEVISKMKKPGDRNQCHWNIYMLSLIGRRNETFQEKEVQILNEWINRYREEYWPAKPISRY